ncbi:DNA-binding transcriptional regulator [Acidovorax sp. MR-S7]|uniref:helix-turn-helix domain-containing protein n=1 Tax=Acidovorax sp. MR-S7 TaxID=1268622 RepID=UPI000382A00C|nr:helix-turn-helix domain-containing protein [Acidovorax sp. MR-S7]
MDRMNGADLKAALKEIGWSQGRLARELGVNPVTVSRWATGQLEVPRYAVAYLRVLRLAAQMLGEE